MIINVFKENISVTIPRRKITQMVEKILNDLDNNVDILNVILADDDYITSLNQEFLNHHWTTDVITFSVENNYNETIGEIYISAITARNQAREYNVNFTEELLRLTAHGCLHLCGYNDSTEEEREEIRKMENKYLEMILNKKISL